ncbi:MAG TPA: hypothetical protein VHG72_20905, partial [Polyangia bacterium]|nr:hypothetical protein [Polyangia bacterium]
MRRVGRTTVLSLFALSGACSTGGSGRALGPSGGSYGTGGLSGGLGGSSGGFTAGGSGGALGVGGENGVGGTTGTKDASTSSGASDAGGSVGGVMGSMPTDAGNAQAPSGLLVDLLSHPENAALTDATPKFGWIVNSTGNYVTQTAYRVLVSSSMDRLSSDDGDLWDSGKVNSSQSINVAYAGNPLVGGATYSWKVATWDSTQAASVWSAPQTFVMATAVGTYKTATEALVTTHVAPSSVVMVGAGHYFIDFGLDAFGWLELTINAPNAGTLQVNIGEKANGQSVDLNPGATIRWAKSSVTLQQGTHTYRVVTPTDAGTINPPATIGNVMPFRYAEVLNSPVAVSASSASQVAVTYPNDPSASSFSSSSANLDAIWGLAKHTMFATTFAGVYVDGDRERTPYEADAYIHQLGHYAVDRQFAIARYSHEYLLTHP